MKKLFKTVLSFCILGLWIVNLQAQEESVDLLNEVDKAKATLKADPFKIGGTLNTDIRYNSIFGIERRADPFDFRVNGSISLTTFGIKSSLNVNISDGRVVHRINRPNVKLPAYAFLGMSPTYKWAKLHLGYRSLSFSPYTLSGNNFYGAGFEINPKRFLLAGFYGRLQRAKTENLDIPSAIDPSFSRWGWGIKTGYKAKNDELYFILFSAKDNPNSIIQPILRNDILPAENLVVSLTGKKQISNVISLDFDYAWSAFTRDVTSPDLESREDLSLIYDFGGLFIPKVSTGFHKALNTGLNFKLKSAQIDLRHEKVDPGYRSLGALFFNNDFERVTTGIKKDFLNKKWIFNARIGLQRNNLSQVENNSMRQIVGSLNAIYKHSERISFNTNLSNFSNTNILRISQLPIPDQDSLILTQVNRNFQLGANYIVGENKQSIFNSFISYQQFNSITNDIIDLNKQVDNIVGNISHTYRFKNGISSLSNSVLINYNLTSFSDIMTIAPTHAYSRSFLNKKLKAQFVISNALLFQSSNFSRHILATKIGLEFMINKKNKLKLSLGFVNQTSNSSNIQNFREFNTRIRYQVKF